MKISRYLNCSGFFGFPRSFEIICCSSSSYFLFNFQLVENVAICLIRITERVSQSSEMLDELCKRGLIEQTTHLVNSNSRTNLSLPVYNVRYSCYLCLQGLALCHALLTLIDGLNILYGFGWQGLLGVLVKLSSGSTVAFRTLFELNISSILKDILSNYDLSHGVSSPHMIDGQGNQVHILTY